MDAATGSTSSDLTDSNFDVKVYTRKFICGKCGWKGKGPTRLSEHKRNEHPRYFCGNCKRKYRQFAKWAKHLRDNPNCADHLNEDANTGDQKDTPATPNPAQGTAFFTFIVGVSF